MLIGRLDTISHIKKNTLALSKSSTSIFGILPKTDTVTVSGQYSTPISVSSSNTSVATASVSGTTVTITGVGAGSATVTVSTPKGEYTAGSKTCSASVTAATVQPLSVGRTDAGATSTSSYAIFAGGYNGRGGGVTTVDAYNSTLTRTIPATLPDRGRYDLVGTTIGNYALFGGGGDNTLEGPTAVYAYSNSLSRSTIGSLRAALDYPSAASNKNYALFAGSTEVNNVDAYDSYLSRTSATGIYYATRSRMGCAGTSNYVLFAGGRNSEGNSRYYLVDAYNTSLTRSLPSGLSVARYSMGGTTVGNYILFAGGVIDSDYNGTNVVDAYNSSLTRSTPTVLSYSPTTPSATSLKGQYALFASGGVSATLNVYNTSLTRTTPSSLSSYDAGTCATSIGDFAIFAGAYPISPKPTVDVFDTEFHHIYKTS